MQRGVLEAEASLPSPQAAARPASPHQEGHSRHYPVEFPTPGPRRATETETETERDSFASELV